MTFAFLELTAVHLHARHSGHLGDGTLTLGGQGQLLITSGCLATFLHAFVADSLGGSPHPLGKQPQLASSANASAASAKLTP